MTSPDPRRPKTGLFGPAVTRAPVTLLLAAACIAVFLYVDLALDPGEQALFIRRFALIPPRLFGTIDIHSSMEFIPAALTLITALFVHVDLLHLILNMVALVSFGVLVEPIFGSRLYLIFYLLCGIAGGLLQALMSMNYLVPVIGASGAILGILGAALVIDRKMKILLLFVPLRLDVALGLFGILHLVAVVIQWQIGIAWWAHIGGFVAGLLLTLLLRSMFRRRRQQHP